MTDPAYTNVLFNKFFSRTAPAETIEKPPLLTKIYLTSLLKEIIDILDGRIIYGEDLLDREVFTACGSDMMSDVLAFVKEQAVLLTGLVNPQVVRTAEMMDMSCIVFVRGKSPDMGMIDLAEQRDIVLIGTDLEMFTSCGRLYAHGLRGGSGK